MNVAKTKSLCIFVGVFSYRNIINPPYSKIRSCDEDWYRQLLSLFQFLPARRKQTRKQEKKNADKIGTSGYFGGDDGA